MTGKRGKTPPDEGLVPDSSSTGAERPSQPWFTLNTLLGCLLLILAINEANWRVILPSSPVDLGPRTVVLRFEPIELGSVSPRLRVAGAWRVDSADPRFGGISALAIDGGELLALTDSGGVIRFAKPRAGDVVGHISEVAKGPRTQWLKANRDIEAITADPAGRGWWAAFEHPGEVWLYDPSFREPLERIKVGRYGGSRNAGVEGLASDNGELLLFSETGGRVLRIGKRRARHERIVPPRRLSDVASLGGGRFLSIERRATLRGFRNRLVEIELSGALYRRTWALPLPAGPLDNFEGLAVERTANGLRLWLVSDDNFQKPFRTVVLALDLLAGPRPAAL